MQESFPTIRARRDYLDRAMRVMREPEERHARQVLAIENITACAATGESIGVTAAPAADGDDGGDDGGGDSDPEPRRRRKSSPPRTRPSAVAQASTGRTPKLAPSAGILLRLPAVILHSGKSKPAIYAAIARGEFPAPVKIGARAVAWRDADIAAWQAGLSQGSGPAPVTTTSKG